MNNKTHKSIQNNQELHFQESVDFHYLGKTIKIAQLNHDYYVSLSYILELGDVFESNTDYTDIYEHLEDQDKILYTFFDGEDALQEIKLFKIEALDLFKEFEGCDAMKKFFTQLALYTYNYLKVNDRIKKVAGLYSDVDNNKTTIIDGVEFKYVKYNNRTFIQDSCVNEYLIKYTRVSDTFYINRFIEDVKTEDVIIEPNFTGNYNCYYSLNGINQSLKNLVIRNENFNKTLMKLNNLAPKKEHVNFNATIVNNTNKKVLKLINNFVFQELNIPLFSVGKKLCFDVESILLLNKRLGLKEDVLKQFESLSSKHKFEYHVDQQAKKLIFVSGLLSFFKNRGNGNKIYEAFFILFSRHIIESGVEIKFPTIKDLRELSKLHTIWELEERRHENVARREKIQDLKKGDEKMILIKEKTNPLIEWIGSKELGDFLYNKSSHPKIKYRIKRLLDTEYLDLSNDIKEGKYKKKFNNSTRVYPQYMLSKNFVTALMNSEFDKGTVKKYKSILLTMRDIDEENVQAEELGGVFTREGALDFKRKMEELNDSNHNKLKEKGQELSNMKKENTYLLNKIEELEHALKEKEVKKSDDFNLKDELTEYSSKRATNGLISDTATRATFIIDDEVLERLDNFTNYIEASNASKGSYNPDNKSEEVLRRERAMAKGIKSKLLSLAIKKALDEWEQIEHIPETEKVRYPVSVQKERGKGTKKEWHRAYMFTHEGITYGISMDGRSNQVEYLTTDKKILNGGEGRNECGLDQYEIVEWFNNKKEAK